ncbi:siderophore-interacting protein [Corynebacterium cystitidis]|uniref:NADPH-dependent ferric siderophore reductase, contains FAD-binding and SIP domains n=1 Tax=Corynebacterium cystitidis DSM 20524 TaxID=1121357 RepID=A0A1H9VU72_9CORY|nr:siderophore-interacting protein [Corynebacterium cystitidis]WJY81098.1 Vibriobactin utilization protein ViuB [Corynebacterium cystitidis DSM 20524]SES25054.1 NADPH-dependent ferric siderophore reductase, contains FAD-binding and SIP domains [Corynebacterium cystitidis DSM 20524]SNV90002.1 putative iron utilization protein [Corynebacterium cystitidis]
MNHSLELLTVTSNQLLKPRLRRLTFYSPSFQDFRLTSPDEFFGLLMPQSGQQFQPFKLEGANIRAAVAQLPKTIRPDLRWYTIRHHHPTKATIDVDIVTHGDNGPGSRWISSSQPGMTAGMYRCDGLWAPPTSSQLLLADASALPALRHILEYCEAHMPYSLSITDVIAVITDFDEVEDGLTDQWARKVRTLRIIEPQKTAEPEATIREMNDICSKNIPTSVWVAGEGEIAKAVRSTALDTWGIPKEQVTWSPYWFYGRARP